MDYKKKYLKYKLKYLNARKAFRGGYNPTAMKDTNNNDPPKDWRYYKDKNIPVSYSCWLNIDCSAEAAEEKRQQKEEKFFKLIKEEMKTEKNKCGLHAFLEAKIGQFAVDDELGGTLLDKGMSRLQDQIDVLKNNFTKEGKNCNAIDLNISESHHHKADQDIYNEYKGTKQDPSPFKDYLWKQ